MIANDKSFYVITDENNDINEEDDTYRQNILEFNKDTIKIFEIWNKDTNKVSHLIKEIYEYDLYMSKEDFEEIIWDDVFEFRYLYSGEIIETFEKLRELVITEYVCFD